MEGSPNMRGSGNLWHHQKEQRDLTKQRQRMFLDALNEQRKVSNFINQSHYSIQLERQRKEIDQKFEALSDYKIEMDKNARLVKEDEEKEEFRRRFEIASRQNDVRLNYYLNNYYLPPKEKDLRNNVASERMKGNSNRGRKIRMMKKRRADTSHDNVQGAPRLDPISHDQSLQNEYNYGGDNYYPKKSKVLSKEFSHGPTHYEHH